MKQVLLWLWQLPQHLLALAIWGILRLSKWLMKPYASPLQTKNVIIVRFDHFGLSLGEYVFIGIDSLNGNTIQHEYGHTLQSRLLGPLYLLLIGLPSISGNIYDRIKHKGPAWYYRQPWEAWADRLGGVTRA